MYICPQCNIEMEPPVPAEGEDRSPRCANGHILMKAPRNRVVPFLRGVVSGLTLTVCSWFAAWGISLPVGAVVGLGLAAWYTVMALKQARAFTAPGYPCKRLGDNTISSMFGVWTVYAILLILYALR